MEVFMLSDQFAADSLKQAGLWGNENENLYFLGQIVKPAWKTALELTNYYASLLSKNSYAIINRIETGIGILPIKFEKGDAVSLPQLSCLIPNEELVSVEFKPSFMAKKLVIKTTAGKPSSFIVEPKNRAILQHEVNFAKFISVYS